ncbi:MAG: hypothetical protein R6V53_07250 [Candidatus Woesearchaeota archaeon]
MRASIDDILQQAGLMPEKVGMYDTLRLGGFERADARALAREHEISYATVYSWIPEIKGAVPLEVKVRDYAENKGLISEEVFDSSDEYHRDVLRVGFLSYFTGSRLGKKHNEVRLTCTSKRCDQVLYQVEETGFSYKVYDKGKSRTIQVEGGEGNCFGYFMKGLLPELQETRRRMISPPALCEHDYQPFLEAMFASKGHVNGGVNLVLVMCKTESERDFCKKAYTDIFEQAGISPSVNGENQVRFYVPLEEVPSWYNFKNL